MRKLKYHESKLLKRVDFLNWSHENNLREVHVLRRYLIQDREDYHSYNKLVGLVTKLVTLLKKLDERDAVRVEVTDLLLDKLHGLGVIQKKRLSACDRIAASCNCFGFAGVLPISILGMAMLHSHFAFKHTDLKTIPL